MKYPTISALCEGVAGAIREKEGSTALINPQDFVDRIKGLQGGGGEEYGVYLKILDVDCGIDDSTATFNANSPDVLEFFSDAFSIGGKEESLNSMYPYYSIATMIEHISKVAIEAKKKEMGMSNVYDTLQKKAPLLAVRTKRNYYDGELNWTERLLVIDRVWDYRNYPAGFANSGKIYGIAEFLQSNLGYDDIYHPTCTITFDPNALKITNIE